MMTDSNRNLTFSVLMSVYQYDDPLFLSLALESIYSAQTKKPDEIIIVFDGPLTDELLDVLNNFQTGKESFVHFLPQEVHRGLGEALRFGSEKCTGDYIFRMDADDISSPHRFERQAEYIQAHPEIDVLGADILEFRCSLDEKNKRIRSCPAEHQDIVRMARKRNPMNHTSVCIKKSALIKSGGYQTLPFSEDYFLWLRMIVAGCTLANLNEPLILVRIGDTFETRRSTKEIIIGRKFLLNYMLENGLITKLQAQINLFCIRLFVNTPSWAKKILYPVLFRKPAHRLL